MGVGSRPWSTFAVGETDLADGDVCFWEVEEEAILGRIAEIVWECSAGRGTPPLIEEWAELTARTKTVGRRVELLHEQRHRRFLRQALHAEAHVGRGTGETA